MLRVELSSHASKFLKNCDKALAQRLVERMERLALDPFPSDVKRIVNRREKVYRVRVGEYRIQYTVIYDQGLVLITDVDRRERAY